ncbi:MAG: DUF2306 domain-containing protein [Caulobacterales bacterium]
MTPPSKTLSIGPDAQDPFHSTDRERLIWGLLLSGLLAGALALVLIVGGSAHLHWPNLSLLAGQPAVLLIHIGGALTALIIGAGITWGAKGTTIHRALGWIWVVAMMTTAGASFFLHFLNPGGFSPIHALSAYVAIAVPMGVAFARRHDIRAHRRMMTGNFLFGLIVAGAFTFAPGRLMWKIFLG